MKFKNFFKNFNKNSSRNFIGKKCTSEYISIIPIDFDLIWKISWSVTVKFAGTNVVENDRGERSRATVTSIRKRVEVGYVAKSVSQLEYLKVGKASCGILSPSLSFSVCFSILPWKFGGRRFRELVTAIELAPRGRRPGILIFLAGENGKHAARDRFTRKVLIMPRKETSFTFRSWRRKAAEEAHRNRRSIQKLNDA